MAQLISATAYNPRMGDGSHGVIQVVIGSGETVTIQGSLNGTDYVTIETVTTDMLKEIVLTPYVKYIVSGGTQSKVFIDETR
jgi:uncharacterized protein YraI